MFIFYIPLKTGTTQARISSPLGGDHLFGQTASKVETIPESLFLFTVTGGLRYKQERERQDRVRPLQLVLSECSKAGSHIVCSCSGPCQ